MLSDLLPPFQPFPLKLSFCCCSESLEINDSSESIELHIELPNHSIAELQSLASCIAVAKVIARSILTEAEVTNC